MRYLITQLLILIWSVIFLYYLSGLSRFIPLTADDLPNWYNVFIVFFLLFMAVESFMSVLIFLFQKFIICNWKEFPPIYSSLKWGIGLGLLIVVLLILNIFHLLNLWWGLAIAFVIFIGFVLIK